MSPRLGVGALLALVVLTGCSAGAGEPRPEPSARPASCAGERPAVRTYDDPVAELTVASFNVDRTGRPRGIAADVRRLLGRDDLDVVGWQEADTDAFTSAVRAVPGWRTAIFDAADGQRQAPGATAPTTRSGPSGPRR